jgi:hypothetical protein
MLTAVDLNQDKEFCKLGDSAFCRSSDGTDLPVAMKCAQLINNYRHI